MNEPIMCDPSVEIYFAFTKDLASKYSELNKKISSDEQLQANKFYFDTDRQTYITCHALLRLILAKQTGVRASGVNFKFGENRKPGLVGDQYYFNISHTREAFAIAISDSFNLGLDIDTINQEIDIYSVANSYFTKNEINYIFNSEKGATARFILLWTRKEALLKAIGTGLTDDFGQVEVYKKDPLISERSFDKIRIKYDMHDFFLYSRKIENYFLTVATPGRAKINYFPLNSDNIHLFIDK